MLNLKELWNRFKAVFWWFLLPLSLWLVVHIGVNLEPLFLESPQLSSWQKKEGILLPIHNTSETVTSYGALSQTATIPSTVYVAFPSYLPSDISKADVPFAVRVQLPVTNTARVLPVFLDVEVNNKPVEFMDSSGNKVISPLLLQTDGEPVLYRMVPPFKNGLYKVSLSYDISKMGNIPGLISERDIQNKRDTQYLLFDLIKLFDQAILISIFIGPLVGQGIKIQGEKRKELKDKLDKLESELRLKNIKIEQLVKQRDYQAAWPLYQDATRNYLNLLNMGHSKAVDELNPLMYIGSGPFGGFVDVWYSKKESLFFRFYDWLTKNFRKSQKGINPLKALSWADYNLDSISHKMIFDKLLDNPKWLKRLVKEKENGDSDKENSDSDKENSDLDNDLIIWIKENFSTAEWSELILKNNIPQEDLDKICNAITEPQEGRDSLSSLPGEDQKFEFSDKITKDQSLLIVSLDDRAATMARKLLRELWTPRGLNRPFPCYTEKLPSLDGDSDFLVWLFSVIGQGIIEFLCLHPYYWNESDVQTKIGIAIIVNAVYTRSDLNTLFIEDRSKPMLKSLLSYMEKAPSITPDDASKLEFYLSMVSRISIAVRKGILLIVNPLSLDESKLNALAMRAQMLARYKIFLRLFVDKQSSIELNRRGFDDIIYL